VFIDIQTLGEHYCFIVTIISCGVLFTDTAKLAAIFQNNHTLKPGRESPMVISDSSNEAKEISTEKRQFLLSGVPEELQKRLALTTTEVDTVNCPPWPTVSHVQQAGINTQLDTASNSVDVWNLPEVLLDIPLQKQEETGVCAAPKWDLGSFLESRETGRKHGEDKFEMVKLSTLTN